MMDQRLTLITLGVADLARSIAFYEGLSWRRAMQGMEGVAFFQLGGIGLSLYPHEALAADAKQTAADLPTYRGITLAHNVRHIEEVDAIVALMSRLGGTVQAAPENKFWGGYGAYVADPDGHLWEIAWNPGFALETNGDVRIPAKAG